MAKNSIEDITFEKRNFVLEPLDIGDYEYCEFINCDFSRSNLSNVNFTDCVFKDCDMSMARLTNTAFREVKFVGCKLLGLQFTDCNTFLFTANFNNCTINHSSFYKMKLKQIHFSGSSLKEVDFSEADLTGALFDNCNLTEASFENTILEKADLRTAHHYSIDPEKNRIKKAKFALNGVVGLLDKYDIIVD